MNEGKFAVWLREFGAWAVATTLVLVLGVFLAADDGYRAMWPMILGGGTLYVALSAYLFQRSMRSSPFALEHYKRNCDMLTKLGSMATRIHKRFRYHPSYQDEDRKESQEELSKFLDDNIVMLSDEGIKLVWRLKTAASHYHYDVMNPGPDIDLANIQASFEHDYKLVLDHCRRGVQSEKLSQETLRILSGKLDDPKRPG